MNTYVYVHDEFMYRYEYVSVCPHINTFRDYPIHKRTEYIININTYVYVHDEFMYRYEYVSICQHMNTFSDYLIHMRTMEGILYSTNKEECIYEYDVYINMSQYLYVHT